MFTWCSKKTNVRYKNVRYIEGFLWEFDRDSAGSLKKCPLLPGVHYIACPLYTALTKILKCLICLRFNWKSLVAEANTSRKLQDFENIHGEGRFFYDHFKKSLAELCFNFHLQALFVLKIFQFLSWRFDDVEKTPLWDR